MTFEQAKARIAQLEARVQELESGTRNHWRSTIPSEWLSDRKDVFLYTTSTTHYGGLATLIRETVFRETETQSEKTKTGRVPPTRFIRCSEMTDEQYEIYMKAFINALQAIVDARNEAKEKGLCVYQAKA